MCQLPVINPMRNANLGPNQFEDPSEPIYTDPSLFERSRFVCHSTTATTAAQINANTRTHENAQLNNRIDLA